MNPTLRAAHLMVDFQNDFVEPNGQLYVQQAETIGGKIAEVLLFCQKHGIENIASKDWHPEDHISFASQHGQEPYTPKDDGDLLWPDHCVAGTWGADLHRTVNHKPDWTVHKATTTDKDAYSAFQDTPLLASLREKDVNNLFVTGVATDYCIQASVLDALKEGFDVHVLIDAIKGVSPETSEQAIEHMKQQGAKFISTKQFYEVIDAGKAIVG